jgi:hypothetical protein
MYKNRLPHRNGTENPHQKALYPAGVLWLSPVIYLLACLPLLSARITYITMIMTDAAAAPNTDPNTNVLKDINGTFFH